LRLAYLLLSPTFGMHQYTADYANRMAAAGHDVHLVTTTFYPADRYVPGVQVHSVVRTRDRGLSWQAFQPRAVARVSATLQGLQPDVVHITGPHVWNTAVMSSLRSEGIPVIHTIHDYAPHPGAWYGRLLQVWNRSVLRGADHVLVHSAAYAEQMTTAGCRNVTYLRLLHLFLGARWRAELDRLSRDVGYEPQALFFGRMERYKGVPELLGAWEDLEETGATLVLAGKGDLSALWPGPLPSAVDLRNHLIDDLEALDLFQRAAVVVLPYTGASQSALIGAAYFFRKPVIVTRSGALAESVEDGLTGWVVEPGDPQALADALREALGDRARLARMGEAGRAWYDAERQAEEAQLAAVYNSVATRSLPMKQVEADPWSSVRRAS